MRDEVRDVAADEYVVRDGRLVGLEYCGNGYSREDLEVEVPSAPSEGRPMTIAEGPDRAYASECDSCGFQAFEDDGQPDTIPVCVIEDASKCPEPANTEE